MREHTKYGQPGPETAQPNILIYHDLAYAGMVKASHSELKLFLAMRA